MSLIHPWKRQWDYNKKETNGKNKGERHAYLQME
jgi:hypothetical protein